MHNYFRYFTISFGHNIQCPINVCPFIENVEYNPMTIAHVLFCSKRAPLLESKWKSLIESKTDVKPWEGRSLYRMDNAGSIFITELSVLVII